MSPVKVRVESVLSAIRRQAELVDGINAHDTSARLPNHTTLFVQEPTVKDVRRRYYRVGAAQESTPEGPGKISWTVSETSPKWEHPLNPQVIRRGATPFDGQALSLMDEGLTVNDQALARVLGLNRDTHYEGFGTVETPVNGELVVPHSGLLAHPKKEKPHRWPARSIPSDKNLMMRWIVTPNENFNVEEVKIAGDETTFSRYLIVVTPKHVYIFDRLITSRQWTRVRQFDRVATFHLTQARWQEDLEEWLTGVFAESWQTHLRQTAQANGKTRRNGGSVPPAFTPKPSGGPVDPTPQIVDPTVQTKAPIPQVLTKTAEASVRGTTPEEDLTALVNREALVEEGIALREQEEQDARKQPKKGGWGLWKRKGPSGSAVSVFIAWIFSGCTPNTLSDSGKLFPTSSLLAIVATVLAVMFARFLIEQMKNTLDEKANVTVRAPQEVPLFVAVDRSALQEFDVMSKALDAARFAQYYGPEFLASRSWNQMEQAQQALSNLSLDRIRIKPYFVFYSSQEGGIDAAFSKLQSLGAPNAASILVVDHIRSEQDRTSRLKMLSQKGFRHVLFVVAPGFNQPVQAGRKIEVASDFVPALCDLASRVLDPRFSQASRRNARNVQVQTLPATLFPVTTQFIQALQDNRLDLFRKTAA
jgi:hypothetical protein